MPGKNRYGFLLSEKGDVAKNVSDIYAQLQAPGQRKAVTDTINNNLNRTVTYEESTGVVGPDNNYIYRTVTAPDPVTDYGLSIKSSNMQGRQKLIDPTSLVSAYTRDLNRETLELPRNIKNAYINPEAEGAYDIRPLFDWQGRTVSGIGSNPSVKGTAADARMYELSNGRDAQKKNYDATIDKTQDNFQFNETLNQFAYNQQRYDPDYSYNLQRSQGQFYNYPIYQQPVSNGLSYIQQQYVDLERSQTRLSPSFYGRGGYDNPTSFPAGYRL